MKYLFTVALVFITIVVFAQNNQAFVIKGIIKNGNGRKIWLVKMGDHSEPMDSIMLNNMGVFTLTMNAPEEARYYITWEKNSDDNYFGFINDINLIVIKGDLKDKKSFNVENSKLNSAFRELNLFMNEQEIKYNSVIHKCDSLKTKKLLNENLKNSCVLQLEEIQFKQKDELFKYLSNTQSPAFKWHILVQLSHLGYVITFNEIEYLLQQAVKEYPQHKGLNNFAEAIANIKKSYLQNQSQIGQLLPNISLSDTKNKIVNLTDFKGKYFLLDFWASWCSPCRKENIHLTQILKQFSNKNFNVVGISLDDRRDYWLEASKKDHITWTNLSDLKGLESPAAKSLNVVSLPRNFLIDPQGTIIAVNLYGEALENKLKEVLIK